MHELSQTASHIYHLASCKKRLSSGRQYTSYFLKKELVMSCVALKNVMREHKISDSLVRDLIM